MFVVKVEFVVRGQAVLMGVVQKEVLPLNKLTKDFKFRFFDIWSVQQTSGLQWIRQVLYIAGDCKGERYD